MFCLQRKDVFPVGDLGIQKGIRDLFSLKELPEPKTMKKFSADSGISIVIDITNGEIISLG